jgi:hypothetical protein
VGNEDTPDNSILVTADPSEDDEGNNFVNKNNGSKISGTVKDNNCNPTSPGVKLALA